MDATEKYMKNSKCKTMIEYGTCIKGSLIVKMQTNKETYPKTEIYLFCTIEF